MNISYRELPCWQEETIAGKYPISMETVVPDSKEDAARVIWARACVLLKGKEPAAHSCSFLGEVNASVLYETEAGGLDVLRLRKEFNWNLETGGSDAEALPQIACWPTAVEARLLNPRKIGVSMELHGLIRSFTRGSFGTEPQLPQEKGMGLQFLTGESNGLILREVKEKAFSLREQLPLEKEASAPMNIEGEELRFLSLRSEQLGERTIVRGEAELRIWGLNNEGLPVSCSFRIPFSQLMETVGADASQTGFSVQASSLYLDWHEGLDGERSLDAELHAVLQLRIYQTVPARYVTDAYSTRMPCSSRQEHRSTLCALRRLEHPLLAEETLPIPDDVRELLAWETILGPLERDREGCGQTAVFQLLVRRKDGSLDGITRSARLHGAALGENTFCGESRLDSCRLELLEGKLQIHAAVSLLAEQHETEQLAVVTCLELEEEQAWDPAGLPTVSLVRRGGESLWNLAKAYRSSVEAIEAYNAKDSDLLLIPAL